MRLAFTRRVAAHSVLGVAIIVSSFGTVMSEANTATAATEVHVYVGTYTDGKSKGIYLFRLNTETGKLTPHGLAVESPNPSFLAIHPSRKYLYAANELSNFDGHSGAISSYSVDQK